MSSTARQSWSWVRIALGIWTHISNIFVSLSRLGRYPTGWSLSKESKTSIFSEINFELEHARWPNPHSWRRRYLLRNWMFVYFQSSNFFPNFLLPNYSCMETITDTRRTYELFHKNIVPTRQVGHTGHDSGLVC
jgi:hypothetical protein